MATIDINIIDKDDPRNLWVSPNGSDGSDGPGTYERPFASIPPALEKTAPGRRVVLMPGVYRGDLTIEISGSENAPVYIAAYKTGETIINGGCWYFYDTSDLVVSGLTFRNTGHGSVYVIGACSRNRFHGLSFVDGAADGSASCALFFGGGGGRFNIVEGCVFSRAAGGGGAGRPAGHKTEEALLRGRSAVGLMVSGGGYAGASARGVTEASPLTNHIVRHNRFSGYDESIIVGASDIPGSESGHVVELNTIENCARDGITVRCGDVQIRGNAIRGCASAGISLSSGDDSTVEGNRISGCGCGISVRGAGHTVAGNRVVGCGAAAVAARTARADEAPAVNLYIYDNYFVNCGTDAGASAVVVEDGASGVAQNNRFYGQTRAHAVGPANKNFVIADNAEGLSVDAYADDGNDVFAVDGDTGEDGGYVEASIPDDVDDGGSAADDDVDGQEEIINFMFGREGWDR